MIIHLKKLICTHKNIKLFQTIRNAHRVVQKIEYTWIYAHKEVLKESYTQKCVYKKTCACAYKTRCTQ